MGIPDRWLAYKPISKKIESTRFVAFKVPLRDYIFERLPKERHTTEDVMKKVPNLGMVINLTNTMSDSKYYDPSTWPSDVQYLRIKCEGHVVPSRKHLKKFCKIVAEFTKKDPERLIGVHCTHGLNRTGYFICSYMTLCQNIDPNRAIKSFNKARFHDQERKNYLDEVRLNAVNEELREDILNGPDDVEQVESQQQHQQNHQEIHSRHNRRSHIHFTDETSHQPQVRMDVHVSSRHHLPPIDLPDNRRYKNGPPPVISDRSKMSWKRPHPDVEQAPSRRYDASHSRPPPLVAHRSSSTSWRGHPPTLKSSHNPRQNSTHHPYISNNSNSRDRRNDDYYSSSSGPPARTRFTKEPRREENEYRTQERTRFTGNLPRMEHDRPRASRYQEPPPPMKRSRQQSEQEYHDYARDQAFSRKKTRFTD